MSKPTHAILVIEDERPLIEAITVKLEKNGFEVVSARSVEQAMNYVQEGVKIQAVWLDHYLLGKGTGLDFVVGLKQNDAYKSIPIFVVSNSGTADKQHAYLRLGALKYYVKSDYRLETIVKEIKEFLENPVE